MGDLKVFKGGNKPAHENVGDIADKLHDLIMDECEGMPLAVVVGILDVVKQEIMMANS